MEELLEWPYRRWRKAFAVWTRRKMVETVDRRQELHIAALHANTNLDSEQNDREAIIKRLEDYYDLLRDVVGRDPEEVAAEQEAMRKLEESDPFLRASRRNAAMTAAPPMMPGEDRIAQVI